MTLDEFVRRTLEPEMLRLFVAMGEEAKDDDAWPHSTNLPYAQTEGAED